MRKFFSTFHRAFAALLLTAGFAAAGPIDLATPAGLNPGDKFRFLALTTDSTTATSTDISDYNSWVQRAFYGATYGGVTINWKAIGSTSSIDARDNVGGYGSLVPVYKPFTGTRIANDMTTNAGGLWSGSLLSAPDETISSAPGGSPDVWTGTDADGKGAKGYYGDTFYLGDSYAVGGQAAFTDYNWTFWNGWMNTFTYLMYGVSEELTVSGSPVPEIDPAGIGSVFALLGGSLGLIERRRRRPF